MKTLPRWFIKYTTVDSDDVTIEQANRELLASWWNGVRSGIVVGGIVGSVVTAIAIAVLS